jgi:anti-sigma B factor antagonist
MDVRSQVLEGEDGVLISVSGEFDVHTAGQVRDALHEAEALTPQVITVELSDVSFMDSTGLGVLIGALNRAKAREARIVLADPTDRVLRLLALTGMDEHFEIGSAPA